MTTATKLKKATFKHIEAELYCFKETLREIEQIRQDILHGQASDDENIGGGRGNLPSSPTEQRAVTVMTHRRLQQLERIANAIQTVYEALPQEKKKLVQLLYWTRPQRYTWDGLAEQLYVSKWQAMRWRNEIVRAIAELLGWR